MWEVIAIIIYSLLMAGIQLVGMYFAFRAGRMTQDKLQEPLITVPVKQDQPQTYSDIDEFEKAMNENKLIVDRK